MNKRLAVLNGLAILGVVMAHATAFGQFAMYRSEWVTLIQSAVNSSYAPIGTLPYYVLLILRQSTVFSVAAFIFASGWFITYTVGSQPTVSWKIVRSRIIALGIPYLIWSLAIYLSDYFLKIPHAPADYLILLVTSGANGAYYFVPLICYFYLLSPFLVPWARKHGRLVLGVAGAIQLATVLLRYLTLWTSSPTLNFLNQFVPIWSIFNWVFYYMFGMVAGFNAEAAKRRIERVKWLALGLVIPLLALASVEYDIVFRATGITWGDMPFYFSTSLFSLAVIVSVLAFKIETLPVAKSLSWLGTRSYGIYLLHLRPMDIFGRLVFHFFPILAALPWLYVPVQFAIGLGSALLFMWVITKTPLRKYYRYLFG
jgi:peptidoglycan/LPS O-acetylase OafA/YrhL